MPQKRSIFIAAALAAVSCAVTPKYPLPLLFGFAGFFAAYFIRHRRIAGAVGTAVAGALCGLSLVILIYLLSGTSLEENIRHSFLLLFRWSTQSADFGFQAGNVPVAVAIVEFLIRNPVFGVFVVLGIIGWGVRSRRSPDSQALAGAGILLGVLVSSFLIKEFISQYVGPRVLCLALFVPYAFTLFKSPRINLVLRIVFVAGAIVTLVVRVDNVADKFFSTPMNVRGITKTHIRSVDSIFMAPTGILVLADYDHLLEIIPKNERVVAAWPFHPIFRRDLTVVGVDDRPTFRDILPDDDIMKRYFTPEYFLKSLEDHPPAMISISRLEDNYPPEWKETAEYFLSRHPDLYVPFRTRFFEFPVRRDLVKNLSQSSDAGSMIR